MTILYSFGARPNIVKLAPVIAALRRELPDHRHVVVDTGQHYDPMMSAVFREQLGLGEPDHVLGVGSGTHAIQTARVLERIEPVLIAERPDLVVVPGDVNSTIAVALAAAKLEIPVAHLEAGLRSFDRSMPEELNRILTDQLSDLLLIHSAEAVDNLRAEGIPDERIHFVGNTMIDSLVAVRERFEHLDVAAGVGCERGRYLLATLHRPALVDGPLLAAVIERLAELARELPVVFPVHPRTRAGIDKLQPAPGIRLLEPVGYLEFLSLLADAAGVLTDSGGVQEESTFLRTPCFTLRDNTERPVTISAGTNRLLGLDPGAIDQILPALRAPRGLPAGPPDGWDGHAADRVAAVVAARLDRRAESQSRALASRR